MPRVRRDPPIKRRLSCQRFFRWEDQVINATQAPGGERGHCLRRIHGRPNVVSNRVWLFLDPSLVGDERTTVTFHRPRLGERLMVGGQAASCGGAARNPGSPCGTVASPAPFRPRGRTCPRRGAPRGVQALGGFVQTRVRSTGVTVAATTPGLSRSPGRERSPSGGMPPPLASRDGGHAATAFRRCRAVPWPLVAPAASRSLSTDCATGKALSPVPGHKTPLRRSTARPTGSRRGASRSSSLRWVGTPGAVGRRTVSRSVA